MKRKVNLTVSIIMLVVSAFLLTQFTFAWLNMTKSTGPIIFETTEGKIELRGYLFKQDQDNGTVEKVGELPDLEAVQVSSNAIELGFEFAPLHEDDLSLFDFVHDEFSLNTLKVPTYYIELQAFTLIQVSYVQLEISSVAYGSGETAPAFTNYEFRYHVADNNLANGLEYATPTNVATISNKNANILSSSPTIFTDGAGAGNGYEIIVTPGNDGFYQTYFAKSFMVNLNPDMLALYNHIKTNTNEGTTSQLVGTKYMLSLNYSAVPFA